MASAVRRWASRVEARAEADRAARCAGLMARFVQRGLARREAGALRVGVALWRAEARRGFWERLRQRSESG